MEKKSVLDILNIHDKEEIIFFEPLDLTNQRSDRTQKILGMFSLIYVKFLIVWIFEITRNQGF